MNKRHILSGEELVAKGATKHEVSLPVLGLKDVLPNGSWLEQKQVQAALEARKHLVEVERIEKSGVLSHAEWNPDTGLAEVTQQMGGHWQYLGHHVDKKLCLWPEEALYLMETNCLHLKYNETTVSLQQAYSLLLQWKITYLQYRVYASLSRLGYKILRHKQLKKDEVIEHQIVEEKTTEKCETKVLNNEEVRNTISEDNAGLEVVDNVMADSDPAMDTSEAVNTSEAAKATEQIETTEAEPTASCSKAIDSETASKSVDETRRKIVLSRKQIMLQQLMNKATPKKPAKEDLDRLFENIPEMCQIRSVTVTVPEEQYLPRNVFLNNTSYTLSLEKVRNRSTSVSPNNARAYSFSDEVNEPSMGRIWASTTVPPVPTQNVWSQPNYPNIQSMQNGYHQQFWNFAQQRPRFHQYLFGYVYQRPLFSHINFNMSRFFQGRTPRNQAFNPRQPQPIRGLTGQPHNGLASHRLSRKRSRDGASGGPNLYAIRILVAKLKQLVSNNNGNQQENIQSLQRIVNTYNRTYDTDIRLSNNLEIIDAQENIVETITLDDDEPKNKRLNSETKTYEENLNRIKKLALTLRKLDKTGKGTSKHRRAFSNMLKNFNKTYDADVYMENYEVIDRKLILLDSSEDDCVVEETPKPKKKPGKKLRNPFSFLNLPLDPPSTSDANLAASKHKELSTIFRDWLPKEDDFGRPAIVAKGKAFTYDCNEENLLDFVTNYKNDCDNWNHIKMSFWEGVEDVALKPVCNGNKNSLVKPEDCKDMATVFEKLRVVQCCKERKSDCDLVIDFDVYNRDVPNFKKSNPPTPHFRLVCLNASDELPSGADVQAFHDMNADNVPTIFAIVGVSSISYLQMRPTELPLRLPNGEDT